MIPAQAVEAAFAELPDGAGVYVNRDDLRAILEAAAPHISAQALEDIATELDGADRVTRERDGYAATISLPNAAIYLRRHAATLRPTK